MIWKEATARCWAEIDLDELCGNYRRAKDMVGENVQVICVLKGNAYGLGAVTVCKTLMKQGAKIFAVASGDEAEELLDACPDAEVLVLGYVGEVQARRLILKNGILTLFDKDQGKMLVRVAEELRRPVRVHVKAETGLYRLGFSGEEGAKEIADLAGTGCFQMEGLYTHLALHNKQTDEQQFERLDKMKNDLAAKGVTFGMVHALDSIGMVRYPDHRLDAVRIGAWLYGVTPSRYDHPENCRPVAKFKARVAQVHKVAKGEMIGYDDDHTLSRDSVIATITAGYLDGVARLNNVGEVLIHGQRAPIKGLVCMDQMMVDVTDIEDVHHGDMVTFLGDDITLNEYASWGKLNRNEALGRFSRRVVRVYKQGKDTLIVSDFEK